MQKEAGSSSVVILAALATVILTSLYVFENSKKISNMLAISGVENRREEGLGRNLSTLSQLKGMLSDRKLASGAYEPGVYSQDYFANSWNFQKQNFIAAPVVVGIDAINLNFIDPNSLSSAKVQSILEGASRQTDSFDSVYQLKIVAKNRNGAHPQWIESVDVETTALVTSAQNNRQTRVKSIGRIPLAAPLPHSPQLWIRGPGQVAFTQNFGTAAAPLVPGTYTFQLRASGVVHYGELSLAGDVRVFGLDKQTGAITHAARNIKATQVILGEATFDIAASPAPLPGAPRVSMNRQTCTVVADAMPAASPSTGVAYQAAVYGVNGELAPGGGLTGTIFIQNPAPQVAATRQGQALCEDQCQAKGLWQGPHDPDVNVFARVMDGGIVNNLSLENRQHFLDDYSDQLKAAGVSGAVCANYDLMGGMVEQQYHMLPSQVLQDIGTSDFKDLVHKHMEYRQIFALVGPSCEKQPLGGRDNCGCFAAHTEIMTAQGYRPIQTLKVGELVWNPRLRRLQAIVRLIAGPESQGLYEISTKSGSVLVTEEHPFLTHFGMTKAKDLQVAWEIFKGDFAEKVTSIRSISSADPVPIVWNLELEGTADPNEHFVLASGVMTGDLLLQERLVAGKGEGSYE